MTGLDARERRVAEAVAAGRDELVALLADLIAFDTTARVLGDPARDEASLQEHIGGRLGAHGAAVDIWEPPPAETPPGPQIPEGIEFHGRPQLAARFPGSGGGRSLIFNGHIDVVEASPVEAWTSHPNRAEMRDGRLYGRGACDMKGGCAAMTFAAEVLAREGISLRGDLTVCTVTDEESWGAGGLAAVSHGVSADACIVTEPSGLDTWVACRGSLIPTIVVEGRPGHSGVAQPHRLADGAVNAFEKSLVVVDAMRRLQEEWRGRRDGRHPHLSTGDIIPCIVRSGEWAVTYPARAELTYHVAHLPAQADADGWGRPAQREIEDWIARAVAADPWLAEHPPQITWTPGVPAAEIPEDHPIVETVQGASAAIGRRGRITGMDSWHDGASFILSGTPAICFGPGDLTLAHTTDESVPVDELVQCAQALAVAAMRWCGVADESG
ncbi:MAG TPA: ArgE/DapE family deacylase [Gaiellales bacterium]|nr:ArgE/DapE family deacylase [Gaiellales bacterium]